MSGSDSVSVPVHARSDVTWLDRSVEVHEKWHATDFQLWNLRAKPSQPVSMARTSRVGQFSRSVVARGSLLAAQWTSCQLKNFGALILRQTAQLLLTHCHDGHSTHLLSEVAKDGTVLRCSDR